MSAIYCHIPGCQRQCHGQRTATGRPLCDRCAQTWVDPEDDLIRAAKMLARAFPTAVPTKKGRDHAKESV
jgi:hypothetical protein